MAQSTFTSKNKICKILIESFIQHNFIRGFKTSDNVEADMEFTVKVKGNRLAQQALAWADKVMSSQVDIRKIYNSQDESTIRFKLAQAYMYSYTKAWKYATYGPNVDIGEDNLLLRGHHLLYLIIKARNVRSDSDLGSAVVTRRVKSSATDDLLNEETFKAFPWLDAFEENSPSYRFYSKEHEDILFKLKSLAIYHKGKNGLTYSISRMHTDDDKTSITEDKLFLGNCAFSSKKTNMLQFAYSSDIDILNDDVIINPALFFAIRSVEYTTDTSNTVNHSIYRSIAYDNPSHLLRYEVKAVTGQLPGNSNIKDSDTIRLYNALLLTPSLEPTNDGDVPPAGSTPS